MKKKDEEKAEADFISCVAFGKRAETISQYFIKGSQIAIVGSIRTGSYEAQDGTKRYTTDVAVESFDFIESKQNNDYVPDNQAGPFDGGFDDITPISDDSMPF